MTARPLLAMRPGVFRYVLGLIVCATAFGIGTVVASRSQQVSGDAARVLYTGLLVTGAAGLALPCFLAHAARRPYPLTVFPAFATGMVLIGFALCIAAVWTTDGPGFDHTAMSLALIGAAMGHACLVSLAQLRGKLLALQFVSVLATSLFVALLIGLVWHHDTSEAYRHLLGATAASAGVSTLLVPVVEHLARAWAQPVAKPKVASYCPNCGAVLRTLAREGRCQACAVRFRVSF